MGKEVIVGKETDLIDSKIRKTIKNESLKNNKTTKTTDEIKKSTTKSSRINYGRIDEENVKLFHDGKNFEAYKMLGSHVVKENNVRGVRFTTWAPNAKNIYLSGDFNEFKIEEKYKLNRISEAGLWSIFIEGIEAGIRYKFVIETQEGVLNYKSDPYAIESELRPQSASIVHEPIKFKWTDSSWITKRKRRNMYESPMNIYEVHLGSWKTKDGNFLTYEELSQLLPEYVEEMGYTHVEIMPVVEHPLDASWGYQGTGYYSVTSRYGKVEGFKTLINELHKRNIGVILDWVPGHFCKDQHGLYMFDGTPTYEYQEFWRADNAGWGTSNFDLGRPEVRSFLISNAIFWAEEYHIDGMRVDAVSNILYLDYGREHGQWQPNIYGDHGNLEGIDFIKELNKVVNDLGKNVMMIAEESTAWPNVCGEEGLGFNLKWNMGWMNDVLEYVEIDPYFRSKHHGKLNFSMMYHYSENFVLPISHDEVVHGKKSLVQKMHGDTWNKFAGARNILSYMMGHPGKKLSFMGNELGAELEWREYEELDWNLPKENALNKGLQDYVKDLNKLYQNNKCLYELDYDPNGFEWIDPDNNTQSILTFIRKGKKKDDILIFVCNFTPVVHYDFRIGVPYLKDYVEVLNSDDEKYGGSGQMLGDIKLTAEDVKNNNQDYSISIKVPPMGTVVFALDKRRKK